MTIQEELELDITGALDAIESLNEPLTQLGENLTTTLTNAIEAVDVTPLVDQLAELDASGLTTTIDAAVGASDGLVPIDADTSAVPEEINAAVDSADTTVPLEADVSDFGGSIDEALAAANATVVVEADVGDISSSIEAEISGADTTLTIDTGDSGAEVDGLTDDLDELTGAQGSATDASGALQAGIGVLGGNFGDVKKGATSLLGSGVTPLIAGFTAIGGAIFGVAQNSVSAQGSFDRFRDVVSKFRDDVNNVNVGSLNTDLGSLAVKLGSTESALRDTNSTLFAYADSAKFSGKESSAFANNITALSARAVALNPNLGTVEEVATKMLLSFTKGGKGAAKFGLDLSKADIQTRALANTGKTLVAELKPQETAFAAAQLGAEKYGKGLDKEITKGSKNAVIQQRSVTATISSFLEEAGRPLVAPFLEVLKSTIPIVEAIAPILVEQGKETLPAIAEVLVALTPLIKLFAQAFTAVIKVTAPLASGVANVVTVLTDIISVFTDLLTFDIGGFFSGIGEAITGLFDDVVGFGSELIDNFLTGIQEAFPAVIGFFTSVGGTILTAIGDFTTTLGQKAVDLVTGFLNGITTTAVAVFQFFTNLAGTIITTIGDVAGTLAQKGIDLVAGFLNGIKTTFTSVVDFVAGIPGRVVTAVGNVASTLFQAGVDMIQGLINGIVNKAGDIVGILKRQVTDRIPKFIKNALGIGSPSKVLMKIGEDIGDGLALGIEHSVPSITSASRSMIAAALPIPGVSNLPAVTAALPSAGVAAGTAGQLGGVGANAIGGTGDIQIIVNTTSPNPVDVGLETVRQLRAEQFRNGR